MSQKSTCSVGLVQLTSGELPEDNIKIATQYVEKAVKDGAELIFLPENSFYMRREAWHKEEVPTTPSPRYTTAEHPGIIAAQAWAKQHQAWIVIGSIAPIENADQTLPYNRSVVIDSKGNVAAHYDKLHLFDVKLEGGESYAESARMMPGDRAMVVQTPWMKLGLSICYDVRFPHLYRDLAQAGAGMLSIPAAFTVPTGKAHWHVLLRARAIENGCFIAAAAQCGEHPGGRKSYGHSLLINPWGEVLLDLGEAPGYGVKEIDLSEVTKARNTIPSLINQQDYRL